MIVVLYEDPPPSPTFRHLLLLFVLPLSLMVIVVLQEDPPPSPTFRDLLLLCVLPLSLMVSVAYRKILHCRLCFIYECSLIINKLLRFHISL